MVHSEEDRANAVQAAQILFGNATSDALKTLDEQTLLDVFGGVPQATLKRADLDQGMSVIALLAGATGFLASNGAARRALQERSISVNKEKVDEEFVATSALLICDKYLLLQRGKKSYFLVIFN